MPEAKDTDKAAKSVKPATKPAVPAPKAAPAPKSSAPAGAKPAGSMPPPPAGAKPGNFPPPPPPGGAKPGSVPPPPGGVRPKLIAQHIIKSGDTISALAEKYYGKSDQKLWDEIVKANPELKGDSRAAKIGMIMNFPFVPGYEKIDKKGRPIIAWHEIKDAKDTISAIAQEHYGASNQKLWDLIIEANEDLLKGDAKNVKIGMKLAVPGRPMELA